VKLEEDNAILFRDMIFKIIYMRMFLQGRALTPWEAGRTYPLGHLATIRVMVMVLQYNYCHHDGQAYDDHCAGEVLGCEEKRCKVRPRPQERHCPLTDCLECS
jgi:hypothetical protein